MTVLREEKSFKKRILALSLSVTMAMSLATSLGQSVSALTTEESINERTLIPKQLSYEATEGKFVITEGMNIYVQGNNENETNEIYRMGKYISDELTASTGYNLKIVKDNNDFDGGIHLTTVVGDESLGNEGYNIIVKDDRVEVIAYKTEGIFRAVQVLSEEIEKNTLVAEIERSISIAEIGNKAEVDEVTGLVEDKEEGDTSIEAPLPYGPVPSEKQLEYSKEEMAAFIHFGVNTFTDKEWGDGTENPAVFNPTELDPDQWAKVLSENGFKKIIITSKHHDGFSLFHSPGTDHDIANEAINENVRGRDVVKELSEACAKYGLKFGVYLSPWDQNSPNYGNDRGEDYNTFFMNQLTKLLTEYGDIAEVWFDGAKGSGVEQTYNFDQWFSLVKKLQPDALIFSDMGPDVRWIGNEAGYAGEPCWSKIKGDTLTLPHYDTEYLNHGDAEGTHWIMGESDTSIRAGWFFHENQKPKSFNQLIDIYFNSVGKNSTLLLNVPPDKRGLINEKDVERLNEFSTAIKNTFDKDLAINSIVEADSYRGMTVNHDEFTANKITDGDYDTYWTTDNGVNTGSFTIELGGETLFDVISIQEYIPLGQRIESFSVEVYNENINSWKKVYEGQTIGYKRLVRLAPTRASKIRINILGSQDVPIINNVSVYKSDSSIELEENIPDGLRVIDDKDIGTGLNQIQYDGTWDSRTAENGFYNNTTHWTNTAGAKATLRFLGNKFYILSATDPNHGTFNVSIDGEVPIVVDNYGANGYKAQQIVFESDDLEYGEHTVEIILNGNNPHGGGISAHLDAIYVLENESGMIEIDTDNITVDENAGNVDIPLKRIGGSKGEVSVSFNLESGTAIQDKDFQRMIENVTFEDGQTEATTSVVLFDNNEMDGNKYFNVRINKVVGGITGFISKTRVNIMDDETPINLAYNKEVKASSVEQNLVERFKPEFAVDGNREETRWASGYSNDEWFEVDLGDIYDINQVNIYWEAAYGKQYKILVSEDGVNYTEVYEEKNGSEGLKESKFNTVKARYVKMQGVQKANEYGYSIFEFEVYESKTSEPPVGEVDKTSLKIAIDYANELVVNGELENVVLAVVEEFNEALAEAVSVYENVESSEAYVDVTFKRLVNAIWMIEFKQGNKEALQALVDSAKVLVEKEYTTESWSTLQSVLETAENVLADENAMEEEVNKSLEELKNAIDALVKNNINKKELENLVNIVSGLDRNKYIRNTWKLFEDRLNIANTVLADEGVTQEEVDLAYNNLLRAYLGLRLIPDKSALEDLINKVEKLDLSAYTHVTGKVLNDVVEEAKTILKDDSATEKQVAEITNKINSTLSNLQLKESSLSSAGNNGTTSNISTSGNSSTLPKTGASIPSTLIALLGVVAIGGGVVSLKKRSK